MKLIKFPSIEQFRNIVQNVNRQSTFVGLDEEGNAIYNPLLPKPIIKFLGTIKLHGCVSEDTILETIEYGNISIKEIVENKLNCYVKSFDVEKSEIVYSEITNFFKDDIEDDWFEIELENNISIKITGNHPIWLPNLKCYREVFNLKEGDILLID